MLLLFNSFIVTGLILIGIAFLPIIYLLSFVINMIRKASNDKLCNFDDIIYVFTDKNDNINLVDALACYLEHNKSDLFNTIFAIVFLVFCVFDVYIFGKILWLLSFNGLDFTILWGINSITKIYNYLLSMSLVTTSIAVVFYFYVLKFIIQKIIFYLTKKYLKSAKHLSKEILAELEND